MAGPQASQASAIPFRRSPFVEAADARHQALIASYRKLADVFHEVLSEQSLDPLLDRIADTLAELVPYDSLTVWQADEGQRELVPILVRGDWETEILSTRPRYGQGITGWAAEHRQPVLTNAAHLDARVSFIPGTPPDPEALISVPLVARGSLKGVLNIYRLGEQARFVDDELEIATSFGDVAALALDNAQVRAHLEHQAQTDPLTGLYNHRFFHDRLRSELNRASRARDSVALLIFDIDDFKRVNDVHGHGVGDQLLAGLAELTKATVRTSDVVCRLGGEEFAVIMPSCSTEDALGLAARLRDRLAATEFETAGRVTVSIGISQGPEDAMNPRELVACADAAMLTAKARGKDQVVLFEDAAAAERPDDLGDGRDVRSIAHLKMLQSLAGKLNRLNEVEEIGTAIVNELRVLLDYHNCRVYLREGDDLLPIAFRGDDCEDCALGMRSLRCKVGQGITGRAVEIGRSLLVPNVLECGFAIQVGMIGIVESLVAVPFLSGSRAIGVLVVSKLGAGQFDEDDVRLLDVLAGHASVSLEKARMYERQRREAERATDLLDFADVLLEAESAEAIGREAVQTVSRLLVVPAVSLWLDDPSGTVRCLAQVGTPSGAGSAEVIAPLREVGGWVAVRPPDDAPFHLDAARMLLLDELVKRVSVALRRTRA
jgi:diguanylate cyclase (GGDEF)-like protein